MVRLVMQSVIDSSDYLLALVNSYGFNVQVLEVQVQVAAAAKAALPRLQHRLIYQTRSDENITNGSQKDGAARYLSGTPVGATTDLLIFSELVSELINNPCPPPLELITCFKQEKGDSVFVAQMATVLLAPAFTSVQILSDQLILVLVMS
ncbi:hypothetical protein J6590_018703 [Homalodisca vitripennis]|nr:hypothetical protein J6590_018703 [Homalodisca vitripennis]